MDWVRLHLRRSFPLLLCAALFLFLSSCMLWAQTNAPLCGPSPEVQAALHQIYARKQAPNETDYTYWHSRMVALKALVQRYPNSFFAQNAYVIFMQAPDPSTGGYPSERGALKVIAKYKALHEHHPDDAFIETLYAKTLINRDTPAAIKLLDDALRKMPSFPVPDMDLVRIYASRNFRDLPKAESYLSSFLAACPARISAYMWLQRMGTNGFTRKAVVEWRKALGKQNNGQAIGQYPALWGLEFKLHPPSEYPAVRKQVAADVARIRALKLQKDPAWWYALSQGYRLAGDWKQARWAQTAFRKHVVVIGAPPQVPEVSRWFKHNPRPRPGASAEERQAYFRKELKQTDRWIRKYPKSRVVWGDRLGAMKALDDVPAAECASTVERLLQLDQANSGPLPIYWRTYFEFADFLSQKNAAPTLDVELAQKAMHLAVTNWENIPVADLSSTKDDFDFYPNFYWPVEKAQLLIYEAEGYTQLKEPKKALAALAKTNLQLQALDSDMTAEPGRRQLLDRNSLYHRCEYLYWQGMARVAQLEGHNTDAMAYFQSALVARFGSDRMPAAGAKDKLADAAHRLWVKLGGTVNGWNAWYGERANAMGSQPHLEWKTSGKPLPPFRLTDLHGKTWKLAGLRGKVVVLDFWATWCIYCREELPHLEKLAEQYRNQPDVLFLSMDTDDDPGLIDPFLKQHKLTFPVLPAEAYATDTLKVDFIPQIWIVGPDGVVRLKGVGYDPTGNWVQAMKDAIGKFVRQAAGRAVPSAKGTTHPSS